MPVMDSVSDEVTFVLYLSSCAALLVGFGYHPLKPTG